MIARPWGVKPSAAQLNLAVPRANALKAYWPMCEPAGAAINAASTFKGHLDISGNQRHLAQTSVFSNPVYRGIGQFGTCFKGEQSGGCSSLATINNSTGALDSFTQSPVTIEAWLYLLANPAGSAMGIGFWDSGNKGAMMYITSARSVNWQVGATFSSGVFTLALNTWYHLVLTYDGTSVSLYVNGSLKTGPTAATIGTGTMAFMLNGYGNSSASGIGASCLIDLPAVYTRVLTLDEIWDSFNYPLRMLAPQPRNFMLTSGLASTGGLLVHPGMTGGIHPLMTGGING